MTEELPSKKQKLSKLCPICKDECFNHNGLRQHLKRKHPKPATPSIHPSSNPTLNSISENYKFLISDADLVSHAFAKWETKLICVGPQSRVLGHVHLDASGKPSEIRCPSDAARKELKKKIRKSATQYQKTKSKGTLKNVSLSFSPIDREVFQAKIQSIKPPPSSEPLPYTEAVKIMLLSLNHDPTVKNTCFGEIIRDQLSLSLKSDSRANRYSETMKQLALSLQHRGGKSVINILQGKGNEGSGNHGGHLPNEIGDHVFYFPSTSTMREYLPPPVVPKRGDVGRLVSEISRLLDLNNSEWKAGGVSFDEIEIKAGARFDEKLFVLYGLPGGPVATKDIESVSSTDLTGKWGKKVLQVFFTSITGSFSIPIYYELTVSIDTKSAISLFSDLFETMKVAGIDLVYTSSDGFTGSTTYSKAMERLGVHQVFDYSHMVKLGRNALLDRIIITASCCSGFPMKTLVALFNHEDPYWRQKARSILKSDDLQPQDKMALKPIKRLLNEKVLELLRLPCFG